MPVCTEFDALILAGGESKRMGQDKSLLPFGGQTLIEHIAAQLRSVTGTIRISTSDTERHAHLGLPAVCDLQPGFGPLMGIATGLQCATNDWTLVVATDIPMLPLSLVPRLWALREGAVCVAPRTSDGQLHPLFALYHRDAAPIIQARLARGQRRVLDFLEACGARILDVDSVKIANLNDRNAYETALARTLESPDTRT